jgi:putative ubiquitin-RnfH superfamily antitoxin RatB of RatAB toxin-antitoxin module
MAVPAPDFVDVVYALPESQRIVRVPFVAGLTAERAVRDSGLLDAVAESVASSLVLGVFGARVGPHHALEPGDRVEICRPLTRDPRDRRREFAK